MRQIGRGTFTTAYLRDDGKVLLKSIDPIKECMAEGYFPDSHLFPKIKFTDKYNEYLTTYYPRKKSLLQSLKPSHYEFYKELCTLYHNETYSTRGLWDIIETFSHIKCKRKREILTRAAEACCNYVSPEDLFFEISPRNVAVSKTGGLILLDVFFCRNTRDKIFLKELKLAA